MPSGVYQYSLAALSLNVIYDSLPILDITITPTLQARTLLGWKLYSTFECVLNTITAHPKQRLELILDDNLATSLGPLLRYETPEIIILNPHQATRKNACQHVLRPATDEYSLSHFITLGIEL